MTKWKQVNLFLGAPAQPPQSISTGRLRSTGEFTPTARRPLGFS
jgi:hypothetical protein